MVFGVVCALRPEKGLNTLLDAFAQVHRAYPETRLVIVGNGSVSRDLEARRQALHLENVCHFEPATANVTEWLHAIDVFVLPSLSEALSNSLMEAMACGCCAVASRTGGNPELIDHDRTGLLFTPGDAAGLTQCMSRLAASPELRERLAEAGTLLHSKVLRAGLSPPHRRDLHAFLCLRRGSPST